VLEREVSRRFTLADTGPDEIVAAAGGGEGGLPEPLAAALARLRELAAEAAGAEAGVQRLEAERERLATDQERLRANLQGVPVESDLARRYLDRLAASETGIEALDRSLAQAREALERSVAARRDFVVGLRF
jgi:chromosome segregation ATPase